MTKRELRYLFLISILLNKVNFVIRDTNLLIEEMEQAANAKLATLLKKQVEADELVLTCWEDNLDTVLKENEAIGQEIARLQRKLKVKKRLIPQGDPQGL